MEIDLISNMDSEVQMEDGEEEEKSPIGEIERERRGDCKITICPTPKLCQCLQFNKAERERERERARDMALNYNDDGSLLLITFVLSALKRRSLSRPLPLNTIKCPN